ncbi:uncharacterized protein LOC135077225 [Ostrinia nubilalis]|uniref:uncharacterized protein LOC135077225 n=1 Tax=Ostrinia nubilalis TaxID=29057 RepID=UPI003082245D
MSICQCGYEDIFLVKELNSTVRQSIKNIIEKEGFTSYKVNVKDLSTNGGNYFGLLQAVTISGKNEDGKDQELRLFLKNFQPSQKDFTVFNVSKAYQREGFFYRELFKFFEKIEDKYNIPKEERLKIVKGYSETNEEVIILEDVSHLGYKTLDRFDVMSIKFAELAIEQLAKLHAMSFIIRNENPKYFEENVKTMSSLYQLDNFEFEVFLRKCFNKAKETLDEDAKIKLDNFFPKMLKKYSTYFVISPDEAVCVTHTDYRTNNVLVKEVDGQPSEVIPVDYQLACFANPVTDLMYFIFLGSDREFRKHHLEDLKEFYYSTFEKFLSKFDIAAEKVYSKKQFQQDFSDKLEFGLMCFLVFMQFIFANDDDVPQLEKGIDSLSMNMDERYKDRLHGIIEEFIQWGYL